MKLLRSIAIQRSLVVVLAASFVPYAVGPLSARARSVETLGEQLEHELGPDETLRRAVRSGLAGHAVGTAEFVLAVVRAYANSESQSANDRSLTRSELVELLHKRIAKLGGWPLTPSDLCSASPLKKVTVRPSAAVTSPWTGLSPRPAGTPVRCQSNQVDVPPDEVPISLVPRGP